MAELLTDIPNDPCNKYKLYLSQDIVAEVGIEPFETTSCLWGKRATTALLRGKIKKTCRFSRTGKTISLPKKIMKEKKCVRMEGLEPPTSPSDVLRQGVLHQLSYIRILYREWRDPLL